MLQYTYPDNLLIIISTFKWITDVVSVPPKPHQPTPLLVLTKTTKTGGLSDDDTPSIPQHDLVNHFLFTQIVLGHVFSVASNQNIVRVRVRAHAAHLGHVGRGERVLG